MNKIETLLHKLHDLRVLRSSCEDSNRGEFRVHVPEKEFDEIMKLVGEMRGKQKHTKESLKDPEVNTPKIPSNICPGCCYSDGRENHEDGSWKCWRCGDEGEP